MIDYSAHLLESYRNVIDELRAVVAAKDTQIAKLDKIIVLQKEISKNQKQQIRLAKNNPWKVFGFGG